MSPASVLIVTLVRPLIDVFAILMLLFAIFYIHRQQESRYPYVKVLLVGAYALFQGVLIFDLLRNFIASDVFMELHARASSSFILGDVVLLTLVAHAVYFRPPSGQQRKMSSVILGRFPHNIILLGFFAFIAYCELYLIFSPNAFIIGETPNLFGVIAPLKTTVFSSTWLVYALSILVFFLVYSSSLFVSIARKTTDDSARRGLYTVPAGWIVIGGTLIFFNGYLVRQGIDAIMFGYAIVAVAFAVTASAFRTRSVVAGFFEPVKQIMDNVNPFSARAGIIPTSPAKGHFLFEIDPDTGYEQVIKDFAIEQVTNGNLVFVFSSKGSPIYASLASMMGVRLYTFSQTVSYAKPGDSAFEILVPQNDPAVLLDIIEKTISSTQNHKMAILFDSVSDMILSCGIEESYKFLKRVGEILMNPSIATLFLLLPKAHDERAITLVRSLFLNQLCSSKSGLTVVKQAS